MMTHIRRRDVLLPAALFGLLLLGGGDGSPTRNVRLPFDATFAGVSSGSSVWEGRLRGDPAGRLRLMLHQVEGPLEAADPVWHVQARWTVDADSTARSFRAELEGMVDWKTGAARLSGVITAGWMKGAWVQQVGEFVNGDLSGILEVAPTRQTPPGCDRENGGITLPAGFCATVFADSVGAARHVTVAPNGDVFIALRSAGPSIVALRDTDGDGHADVETHFGDASPERRQLAGIAMRDTLLYADAGTAIVRYRVPRGSLRPAGGPDTIVRDLPSSGHSARNLALDSTGTVLFVNVGSRTNACQVQDRAPESPGADPCPELETRAGIWQFSATTLGQRQQDGIRFATGIRNAMGLAVHPVNGLLYGTQHGRDQLAQNWPGRFTVEQGAENPAEELMQVSRGDDFGWPYCFYSAERKTRVLAPEYGGDGTAVGRCAGKKGPLATFPGHWAPMSLLFYAGAQFPPRYRHGAFIAFHGSWNRAPLPQAGFRVVFVPMAGGRPSGPWETFADGFPGVDLSRGAYHRPVGLAEGPDGALFVTDDVGGRIWRVVHRGSGR